MAATVLLLLFWHSPWCVKDVERVMVLVTLPAMVKFLYLIAVDIHSGNHYCRFGCHSFGRCTRYSSRFNAYSTVDCQFCACHLWVFFSCHLFFLGSISTCICIAAAGILFVMSFCDSDEEDRPKELLAGMNRRSFCRLFLVNYSILFLVFLLIIIFRFKYLVQLASLLQFCP